MVKMIDNKQFEAEVKNTPGVCLVDFFATWCAPCMMLAPTIEELSEEFSGSVKFFKIDIDTFPQLASEYKIMSIPTVILFKDGQPAGKIVGLRDKNDYIDLIEM